MTDNAKSGTKKSEASAAKDHGVLYIGMDMGTSRTAVSASNGVRESLFSVVGYPKDHVSQKLLKKDRLFGQEAIDKRLSLQFYRPLENGVLKGTEGDKTIYLDGEAFGQLKDGPRVDIDYPSGDGRRGGDFRLWGWLIWKKPQPTTTLTLTATFLQDAIVGTVSAVEPVRGASVLAVRAGADHGPFAVTDANGDYRFLRVPFGDYKVSVKVGQEEASKTGKIPGPGFSAGDFAGRRLVEVSGVGNVTSEKLVAIGIDHPALLASADTAKLAADLGVTEEGANKLIFGAQDFLLALLDDE